MACNCVEKFQVRLTKIDVQYWEVKRCHARCGYGSCGAPEYLSHDVWIRQLKDKAELDAYVAPDCHHEIVIKRVETELYGWYTDDEWDNILAKGTEYHGR